jgi:uncharacterized protein YcbK (DUF882 family)
VPTNAGPRRLAFYNLHTGERVASTYWADGRYITDHLRDIDRVLRDFRTGDVTPIDRNLLDLLHVLQRDLDTREPFHVISGYRSPRTNEKLRHEGGGGVATNSLHTVGQAIDIRVPGRRLADVRRAAMALWRCSRAGSATTQNPTLCTWTPGGSASGDGGAQRFRRFVTFLVASSAPATIASSFAQTIVG